MRSVAGRNLPVRQVHRNSRHGRFGHLGAFSAALGGSPTWACNCGLTVKFGSALTVDARHTDRIMERGFADDAPANQRGRPP